MKNLALKFALVLLISGLIITLLIGYVERKTIVTYEHNLPYLNLGEHVQDQVVQARLLVEQQAGGNATINFKKQVLPLLNSSATLLQAAYDGKETAIGKFQRSDNEELLAIFKETIILIDKLALAAQERVENSSHNTEMASGGDNASDLNFDALVNQVNASLNRLIQQVNQTVQSDRSFVNILSWISITLLSLVFIGLAIFLYRLQKKSERIVQENARRMEQQARSVTSLSSFIESISAGNFAVDLQMDEGDQGLAETVLNMRDKLRDNAEDDRKRNWTTSGLAQIGEILRSHTDTTEVLYDNIIRFVVKYTNSSQGGLFLLDEETENDQHLSLVACYAFERKKYLKKRVDIGEGMVGQCFLEGERIYLLEVPQEYVSITSGLGGANPSALLITPLKVNEKILGVLELATFSTFQDYEIELVEKLAETIASTISAVRVNESTRILLERTQQQAEEMRAQEEEMRQNMEELEATQEEMRRKEKHIQDMLEGEKQRNEFNNASRNLVLKLSKTKEIVEGRWPEAMEKITRAIAQQLHISRTSIWRYNAVDNKMLCEKLYQADKQTFESGKEFFGDDFPAYVRAMQNEEILMAKDAFGNSITGELANAYLRPLNVQSILNVPFLVEGKVAGFISCEQQGSQQEWTDDHVEFLKSCADLVAVTLNTLHINDMITNLNGAQETLQTIIDNLPRAVFWKDRDLRIQGCNRVFARVAGLTSHKELLGKTDFDMPWREHAEAYRADDLGVMESREARIDQEERNVNGEGVESWVLTSKVPVLNQQGEVVAVLGMFEDITERKQREADIKAKLTELDELKKMLENSKN